MGLLMCGCQLRIQCRILASGQYHRSSLDCETTTAIEIYGSQEAVQTLAVCLFASGLIQCRFARLCVAGNAAVGLVVQGRVLDDRALSRRLRK